MRSTARSCNVWIAPLGHAISSDRTERSRPKPKWARLSDRKSTRLNSSHLGSSYAVFCLKKNHAARGFTPGKLRDRHFDVLIALTARSHGAFFFNNKRADYNLILPFRKILPN